MLKPSYLQHCVEREREGERGTRTEHDESYVSMLQIWAEWLVKQQAFEGATPTLKIFTGSTQPTAAPQTKHPPSDHTIVTDMSSHRAALTKLNSRDTVKLSTSIEPRNAGAFFFHCFATWRQTPPPLPRLPPSAIIHLLPQGDERVSALNGKHKSLAGVY